MNQVVHPPEGSGAQTPAQSRALSGVILCGGMSTRMGRDKAHLLVGDETLIERALRIVSALTPDVVLACGREPRYADLGRPLVCDRFPGAGPLAGLEAALSAAPAGYVVVLACDMPRADARLLERLLQHARTHDLDVALSRSGAGVEPLCGVWSTSMAPHVRAALERGERGVQSLLLNPTPLANGSSPRIGVLDPEAGAGSQADFAFNVNTPHDLTLARAPSPGPDGA